MPIPWKKDDALAVRALMYGNASEGQQKRALDWILDAAMTEDQSFIPPPDNDPNGRLDAFIEGKRSVGNQIKKLLYVNLENVNE